MSEHKTTEIARLRKTRAELRIAGFVLIATTAYWMAKAQGWI